MKKTMFLAALVAGLSAFYLWPSDAGAEGCRVRTPGNYALGAFVGEQMCDQNENRPVTLGTLLKVEEGATPTRYISTGTSDNEFEICATPCQLLELTASSSHTVNVYVKCSEATIGSTTPGSTAIKLDFLVGQNQTVHAAIPPTVGLALAALTCWIVTDISDAGVVTDAPLDTVRVNWSKK